MPLKFGHAGRWRRGNPRLTERVHDPYRNRAKLVSPARCEQCGAVFARGRWTWKPVRTARLLTTCPACRRSNDRYPAGELVLEGAFLREHAAEALRLIRNIETAERREHPLHRIMDIVRQPARIVVTTTDVHSPRRMGHALADAWHGELSTHYDEQGHFARVRWARDR